MDVTLTLKVSRGVREQLGEAASADGRTVSGWVRRRPREALAVRAADFGRTGKALLLAALALAACGSPMAEPEEEAFYIVVPHTLTPSILVVSEGDRIGDCWDQDPERCHPYPAQLGLDRYRLCRPGCDIPFGWGPVEVELMDRLRVGEHCEGDGGSLEACVFAMQLDIDWGLVGLAKLPDALAWDVTQCGVDTWFSERIEALEGERRSGVLDPHPALADTVQVIVRDCE